MCCLTIYILKDIWVISSLGFHESNCYEYSSRYFSVIITPHLPETNAQDYNCRVVAWVSIPLWNVTFSSRLWWAHFSASFQHRVLLLVLVSHSAIWVGAVHFSDFNFSKGQLISFISTMTKIPKRATYRRQSSLHGDLVPHTWAEYFGSRHTRQKSSFLSWQTGSREYDR